MLKLDHIVYFIWPDIYCFTYLCRKLTNDHTYKKNLIIVSGIKRQHPGVLSCPSCPGNRSNFLQQEFNGQVKLLPVLNFYLVTFSHTKTALVVHSLHVAFIQYHSRTFDRNTGGMRENVGLLMVRSSTLYEEKLRLTSFTSGI